MTINTWKHWFWITCPICQVLLFLTAQVTGQSTSKPDPDVPPTSPNVSAPVEEQFKLSMDPPINTNIPTRGVLSDSRSADTDDTVNGRNLDIFPIFTMNKIHGKLYVDRTTGKKYKIKPKTEETVEKTVIFQEDYKVSISPSVSPPATTTSAVEYYSTDSISNVTKEELSDEAPSSGVANTTYEDVVVVSTASSLLADSKEAAAVSTSVEEQPIVPYTLDAGSITGIALAVIVVSGLIGAISFVVYRRRYLNKPQVLNDKSSALDSSGYIDDASLRENSEEMYSLDNDSFLNSLEAMTIQNYWTENVKHTKL